MLLCFFLAEEAGESKTVSGSEEKPPLTQQSRVSFAEGTTFLKGDRACTSADCRNLPHLN